MQVFEENDIEVEQQEGGTEARMRVRCAVGSKVGRRVKASVGQTMTMRVSIVTERW